ncbi:MAG: bifunctional UDP-sugar hydrolase/5'-nucleotidase [Syntrophales bacterium]|nr:bifunctional UDP-sugar hydrolase/5'-nucleotidase [Syntrophales bacterium]
MHFRSRSRALSVFILVLIFSVFPSAETPARGAAAEITILHVNDTHGHILPLPERNRDGSPGSALIGGAANLAAMIEKERRANPSGTLLLSGGDMFQGTPISNVFRGRPVLEIMNELKFDAMAVGNHEFDWGRAALEKLSAAAAFPFLTANIRDSRGNVPKWAKQYIILRKNSLNIAVIGLTTTDTPISIKPGNVKGLIFSRPENVLPVLIREVRRKGADMVIVLSHLGLDADRELGAAVPGIQVIVGGHSHTAVFRPVTAGSAVVVQAKCCGEYLGVLRLKVDRKTGEVLSHTREGALLTVYSRPRDPADARIAGIVRGYDDLIRGEFSRAVGETSADLARSSRQESNIGNLVADAMRNAAGAQIAFQNSGGIRTDIPRGKITMEQVFTALPFDNYIVAIDLTGRRIMQILERNARADHGLLQVSGLRVAYDMRNEPGTRLAEVSLNGVPLDPERLYRVAVNDFLAAGGDGLAEFREGKNIEYGDDLREAVVRYLRDRSPVNPKIEGRINIIRQ